MDLLRKSISQIHGIFRKGQHCEDGQERKKQSVVRQVCRLTWEHLARTVGCQPGQLHKESGIHGPLH